MGSLIKNSLFNILSWMINVIIGIITVPIFINKLNPELYGVFILLLSLLGYYSLMDMGLGQAVIKFISEYEAKKDFEAVYKFIFTSLILNLLMGIIGTLILIVYSIDLLKLLNIPEKYLIESSLAIKIFSIGFFFSLLSANFSSIFQGFQQYKITSLVNILINILINIVSIIGLYLGMGLVFLSVTFSLFYFISSIVYSFILLFNHPVLLTKINFNVSALKELFSFSIFYFLSKILNTVSNYFIQFIISIILNPLAVTYYIVPRKLVNSISAFLGSGSVVIFPKVSELTGQNKYDQNMKLYIQSSKLISVISFPIFYLLFLFSKEILIVWVGDKLAQEVYIIMSLISIQTLIGVLTIIPNNYLLSLGKTKIQGILAVITILTLLIFAPFFTRILNVEGTILSLIVSSIPGIFLVNYLNRKFFIISNFEYWKNILSFNIIIFLISTLLLIIQFKNIIDINILFLLKCLLTLSYFIIYFKENKNFISQILRIVKFKLAET